MDRPSKESSLLINLVKYAADLYDFINFYVAIFNRAKSNSVLTESHSYVQFAFLCHVLLKTVF